MIKTFEEWCGEKGIKIEEVSANLLPTAYKVWGTECYHEAKELKAENAALRERLEKAVEPPKPFIEQDSDGYYRVYSSRISIIRYAKQHGVYDTPEAAEARLKELQGGKK